MVQRNADGISRIILIGSDGRKNLPCEEALEGRADLSCEEALGGRADLPCEEALEGRTGLAGGKYPGERGNSEGSKRRFYFEKAAAEAGIRFSFYDWRDFPFSEGLEDMESSIVKIDAPEWNSCRLRELEELTGRYREQLFLLSRMPFGGFLNHPLDIAEALDKRKCKQRLAGNGIPVTKMYDETFSDRETLLDFMREHRIHQVFLKPVSGSGAAGVTALRFSPVRGKTVLYTCAALDRGELVNTKKLYRLEGEDAGSILDQLLKLDCVVEKWYRKDTFQEYCYDLRVIVQDKRIDYILPRLSRGPVTNLHLNNHSMEFEQLNPDKDVIRDISEVCIRAACCYPGLRSIGMDVLLEKESRKPYIIEMNAQGDLLHRDAYHKNRIYQRQVEIMQSMMGWVRQCGDGTGFVRNKLPQTAAEQEEYNDR